MCQIWLRSVHGGSLGRCAFLNYQSFMFLIIQDDVICFLCKFNNLLGRATSVTHELSVLSLGGSVVGKDPTITV